MEAIEAVLAHILAGDLPAAVEQSRAIPFDELRTAVLTRAFDEQSMAFYGFYVALLLDQSSAERHAAASELLSMALNIFAGAYQLAAYHARQAIAAAPDNVLYKEQLLFFHNNPEELLSRDETRRLAEEILRIEPTNAAARDVLGQ